MSAEKLTSVGCPDALAKKLMAGPVKVSLNWQQILALVAKYGPVFFAILEDLLSPPAPTPPSA